IGSMMSRLDSAFLNYILAQEVAPGERLPTLSAMSEEIGISVGKLREQLGVARSLGLVSVQPRLGTRREAFDFLPAVRESALFALASGEATFRQFSEVRRALETALWPDAVTRLTAEDKVALQGIVDRAFAKLEGDPAHIPSGEHRALHLTIFKRLDNPFVRGLLQAYWDIYESHQLTRLASYAYWLEVWRYHREIVNAICAGEMDEGLRLLIEHFQLLPTISSVSINGDGNV
ncbi:MAG: FCD domain-containing protein, partial [Anaerolineae bacterium]|nr:FCD domain-containing protein [Anaerolineae bacterium]